MAGPTVVVARELADTSLLTNRQPVAGGHPSEPTEADEVAQFEAAKQRRGLGQSGLEVGFLILANTLMGGSGLLGIPNALASAGYALGAILLCVFGCASAFGSHLLQCAARRVGKAPTSFYVVSDTVAPRWTWLIDGAVMVKCFGVGTSYLIIVGDLAPPAMQSLGVKSFSRSVAVILAFAAGGGLACFKKLSALKYTAACAVVIVIWTIILVFLFFLRSVPGMDPCLSGQADTRPCGGAAFVPFASDLDKLGKALPVFIFGFTCQQNVFTVCNEVKDASKQRIDVAIRAAYLGAAASFGSAALLGYITYGSDVQSDLLKGYPDEPITRVTKLIYSLLAVFSYPLQLHPARMSAMALWDVAAKSMRPADESPTTRLVGLHGGSSASSQEPAPALPEQIENRRYLLTTAVLLSGSFCVAITVQNLGKVLGVVGATGSTMVSYVLPGLLYSQTFTKPHFKRSLAWCQLCAGCVIMPTCLFLTLS